MTLHSVKIIHFRASLRFVAHLTADIWVWKFCIGLQKMHLNQVRIDHSRSSKVERAYGTSC